MLTIFPKSENIYVVVMSLVGIFSNSLLYKINICLTCKCFTIKDDIKYSKHLHQQTIPSIQSLDKQVVLRSSAAQP